MMGKFALDGEHEGVGRMEWRKFLAVRDYLTAGNKISTEMTMANIITRNNALKRQQAKVQKVDVGDVYRRLANAGPRQDLGPQPQP